VEEEEPGESGAPDATTFLADQTVLNRSLSAWARRLGKPSFAEGDRLVQQSKWRLVGCTSPLRGGKCGECTAECGREDAANNANAVGDDSGFGSRCRDTTQGDPIGVTEGERDLCSDGSGEYRLREPRRRELASRFFDRS
jgi:hypothetical protein